jgi:hypothetical protein
MRGVPREARNKPKMAWRLIIDFELPSGGPARGTTIHRVRNFGETLYGEIKSSGLAEVSLKEVDKSTDQLCVHAIKTRKVKTVAAMVKSLLERHHLDDIARISQAKA